MAEIGAWVDGAVGAAADRPLIHAAARCVARWGIRKTTLDDIAREAGVGRATAYRVFPGGKDRVVSVLFQHRAGVLFHEWSAELHAAGTLEDLLVVGLGAALRLPLDDELAQVVLAHEPELVVPSPSTASIACSTSPTLCAARTWHASCPTTGSGPRPSCWRARS